MATNGKPTKEEEARLRKRLLQDKAPSSRQQSYQFVYWRQLGETLGQPFDANKIPMSKLYQMRRDPMIAFALHFIKVPLIRAPWYIQCEDAQIAGFIDYALRKIYGRLVLQYMTSLDFGFSAIVKRFELDNPTGTYIDPKNTDKPERPIWDEGNVDAIIWRTFVGLNPAQVEPLWTTTGEFNGIKYDNRKDIPLAFPTVSTNDDSGVDVPLDLSLWITNEKDTNFGSPWGYPRIGYAFRYWWSYWYRWALADRHFEKDADPPAIVRYPDDPMTDEVDGDGNIIDFRDLALGIGEQSRSGSTIALPSNVVESELDGRPTNTYKWDIKHIEGGGNFEAFDGTFDRLEILKLRSIWVPEQAFLEGKGGSSSRNVAHELNDSFEESQAVLMSEFDDHINSYVIPQLVKANFPEFKGLVTKITGGFGAEDIEFARQLVLAVSQSDPNQVPVDVRKVLDRVGIPTISVEEMKRKQEQAMKDAQAAQAPTGIPPVAGRQAGTIQRPDLQNQSKTGFGVQYIQPRDLIYLSEDTNFVDSLPDTEHYKDSEIKQATREARALWKAQYSDFYKSFSSWLASENFDLGDLSEESTLYLDAKDVPNIPGKTNWVQEAGGLPKFIADIAGDLITERGFDVSRAIATAVNKVKKWASGVEKASAKTKAKAAKAWAEWVAKKAKGGVHMSEEIYSDVDFLLFMAEENDPNKRADAIIKKFAYSLKNAGDKTLDIIQRVMARAGNSALKKANLPTDTWNPEDATPAGWAKRHAASLISGIDNSLRDELRTVLSEEIAQGRSNEQIARRIKEHFSTFSDWKADRVARTETMLAYNFATLYAGEAAGIKKVQALDAQNGPTDDECERRNGRVFDLSDAFAENIKEHPNGTLSWRLLPKVENFSIELIPEEVSGEKMAWFDADEETVFFRDDINPKEVERYLLYLGDQLCS